MTLEKVWLRIQQLTAKSGAEKIVLRPRQEQLLQLLRERQSMTPPEIWEAIGVSKQAAAQLTKPLLDARLVRRVGSQNPLRVVPEGLPWSGVFAAKNGADPWSFAQFSGVICEISAGITVGNNHEGSIPFTRSIDFKRVTNQCSNMIKPRLLPRALESLRFFRISGGV